MTDKEALRMALDALEYLATQIKPDYEHNKAITAIKQALAATVQEPVAWMHTMIDDVVIGHRPADLNVHPDRWMPLYKDPTPCQTCEALARTVMMDQTAHDTTPPAQPAPAQEPSFSEGWERRKVIGFDALVEALDYAERKGFMPDYIADAWEGFNYLVDEKHTPPAAQRSWVGLTDDEIQVVLDDPQKYYDTMNNFARAIEAKVKERNQ
jgi:hypothetical protein